MPHSHRKIMRSLIPDWGSEFNGEELYRAIRDSDHLERKGYELVAEDKKFLEVSDGKEVEEYHLQFKKVENTTEQAQKGYRIHLIIPRGKTEKIPYFTNGIDLYSTKELSGLRGEIQEKLTGYLTDSRFEWPDNKIALSEEVNSEELYREIKNSNRWGGYDHITEQMFYDIEGDVKREKYTDEERRKPENVERYKASFINRRELGITGFIKGLLGNNSKEKIHLEIPGGETDQIRYRVAEGDEREVEETLRSVVNRAMMENTVNGIVEELSALTRAAKKSR
ncbi:MAG: hypothetical protein SVV03_00455 [Candidatus Nanohaloarchaea archaeon]|nr:hypothetical protein [Candidatus Nanohaloarchaea archaeon]